MGPLQALLFLLASGIANSFEDLDAFETTPNENYFVTPGGEGPELACSLKKEFTDPTQYKVLWSKYYKENVRIVFDENGIRDKVHYALRGDVEKGIYNLHISNVTRGSVEGEYQCTVLSRSSDEQFMTRRAKVVLLLPPSEPKIVDFPEESLVEGELLVVKCTSEGGSPTPVFTWSFPNGSVADQRLYRTAASSTEEDTTESTFSFRVRADDNDAFVSCSVRNLAMENRLPLEVKTPRLNVLFKPYARVHPADELTVEDGQPVELSCDSHANPSPPSYEWIHLNSGERYIAPKWALVADRKMAGRFECRAKNSVGEGTAELNLIVQYGPVVTTKKYLNPSEKERVEVECLVDANPKPTEVRWTGPDGFVVNGPRLVLPSISRDQTGNYTCEAVNYLTIYDQPGSQERKGRASLFIDVKRKPGKAEPVAINQQVVAGEDIELNCMANDMGSPHAQFKWASPSSGNAFGGEGHSEQTLHIADAQLSDNGIYKCKAWNTLGEGEEGSVRVTVIEPARISRPLTKDYLFSRGDQKKVLECEAQGYPAPAILWYKDGKLLNNDQKRYKTELVELKTSCSDGENCVKAVAGSLLFADAIRWSDKGNYSCAATNNADFSTDVEERISWGVVAVSHSPVILNEKYPTESLAAADLDHTAEISCIVSARPAPTFAWFFNSEPIEENERMTFEMREVKGRMDEYEQVLRLADVKKSDYGGYLCRATNGAGDKAEVVIELKPTDVPQVPDDLQKLSATSQSLLIGWRPRFNGGYAQTFEIEHRMLDPFTGTISKSNPVSIMISNATRIEDVKMDGTSDWLTLYNISGLRPLSTYYIRARSSNMKGTSKYGTMLVATTGDVEEDKTLLAPSTLSYDSLKGELNVSPSPPLDSCTLVYVSTEEVWRAASCYPSTQPIVELYGGAFYKVRFCQRQNPYKCSQLSPVLEAGSLLGSRRFALFVPLAILLFVLVLTIVFLMICCRSRHTQKKIVALAATTFTALPNSDTKKTTVNGSHTDSSIFTMDSSNKLNTSGQPTSNSPDMATRDNAGETWHQVEQHFDTSRSAYLNETATHPNGTLRRGDPEDPISNEDDGGSLGRVMREVIV